MPYLSPQLLIATAIHISRSSPTYRQSPTDHALQQPAHLRARDPEWGFTDDAAFIQHCGFWSHFDSDTLESIWPIEAGRSAHHLLCFGAAHSLVHTEPAEGDIFLQTQFGGESYVHAGIVVEVLATGRYDEAHRYFDVYTVEGNTDDCGRVFGGKTRRVHRRLSSALGDVFVRWADFHRSLDAKSAGAAADLGELDEAEGGV